LTLLTETDKLGCPPPTILESLEGACQKFQYGGNSGDSLYCGN